MRSRTILTITLLPMFNIYGMDNNRTSKQKHTERRQYTFSLYTPSSVRNSLDQTRNSYTPFKKPNTSWQYYYGPKKESTRIYQMPEPPQQSSHHVRQQNYIQNIHTLQQAIAIHETQNTPASEQRDNTLHHNETDVDQSASWKHGIPRQRRSTSNAQRGIAKRQSRRLSGGSTPYAHTNNIAHYASQQGSSEERSIQSQNANIPILPSIYEMQYGTIAQSSSDIQPQTHYEHNNSMPTIESLLKKQFYCMQKRRNEHKR